MPTQKHLASNQKSREREMLDQIMHILFKGERIPQLCEKFIFEDDLCARTDTI